MLHQVSSGNDGNVQDMRVAMKETERINEVLMKMLANNCGKTYDEILKATERDCWMDENEAVKFGIVDEILGANK